jgi:hypothetical protein
LNEREKKRIFSIGKLLFLPYTGSKNTSEKKHFGSTTLESTGTPATALPYIQTHNLYSQRNHKE